MGIGNGAEKITHIHKLNIEKAGSLIPRDRNMIGSKTGVGQ